jgi:hypothetical protein
MLLDQINGEKQNCKEIDISKKKKEHRKNRGHDHYIFYNLKATKDARYVI